MLTPAKQFSLAFIALALVLGWLWFQLIDQLRIEWSLNSQYSYGWFVPFLCLLLVWRDSRRLPLSAHASPSLARLPTSICHLFVLLAALLYLPTRLIQEANPDWRFISWALALEAVALTFCLLPYLLSCIRHLSSVASRHLLFPLCFFLVAVPWPTLIEFPLIQALTRFNAATTIEILNAFGLPALQRGNVIEVSTGLVGIDEACSGIRSFQATLMISLFCGAWYRLPIFRRVVLVLAGFGLAILFNLARTVLLVSVAAKQGVPAIAQWHDPAGVVILLGCFGGLWLISLALQRKNSLSRPELSSTCGHPPASGTASAYLLSPIFLLIWIVAVEIGVEWWYRKHENALANPVAWQVQSPDAALDFKELPIAERAGSILRYDTGKNFTWSAMNDVRWQVIYLQWNAGRVAAHLARNHTPEVCLTAAGHQLQDVSELFWITVHDIALPFRRYTFSQEGSLFHVFYCLREDRLRGDPFTTELLSYQNRFAAVWAGRRNLGQRSIELAVWGLSDAALAEAALRKQLDSLIFVP